MTAQLVLTAILAVVSLGIAQTRELAQTTQQSGGANSMEFEAASVKLAAPPESGVVRFGPTGGPGSSDPGRIRCVCKVSNLVLRAFDIAGYQLSGPAWLNTELAVEAKVPDGATAEQARLMMQKLLADRVKLTFHWTAQQMQGHELAVAKDGPKLQESVEGQPTSVVQADGSQKVTLGNGVTLRVGANIPTAGIMSMMTPDHLRSVRGRQTTMSALAAYLASALNGPVTDATGLKGKYDFTLSYALTLAPPSATPESEIPVATAPLPTLENALQKLGLKLEAKKVSVQVLAIDHLERTPVEN